MQVTVEDIPQVTVGNKGILIRIKDDDKNLGKLWVGKTHVRWAPGNVPEKNARKLPIQRFVDYLNELPAP